MIPWLFFLGISLQLDVLVIVPCNNHHVRIGSWLLNTRGVSYSLNVSPDTTPRFFKKLSTIPNYSSLDLHKILWTILCRHSVNLNLISPTPCLLRFHSFSSPSLLLSDPLEMILQHLLALATLIPFSSPWTPYCPMSTQPLLGTLHLWLPTFVLTGRTRPRPSDFKAWSPHCEDVLLSYCPKSLRTDL